MKDKQEPQGVGMILVRTINGKRVNLSAMKKKHLNRMDMVVEMSARHARLLAEKDWVGLCKLAQEYENLGALTTAGSIRLEIPVEFLKTAQEAQG